MSWKHYALTRILVHVIDIITSVPRFSSRLTATSDVFFPIKVMPFCCSFGAAHPSWLVRLMIKPPSTYSHSCLPVASLCQLAFGSQWDNGFNFVLSSVPTRCLTRSCYIHLIGRGASSCKYRKPTGQLLSDSGAMSARLSSPLKYHAVQWTSDAYMYSLLTMNGTD